MQNDVLSVARFKLQHIMPYLADGIYNLIPVVVEGFPTMAVDEHWRLYYDPAVISEKWSLDEVVAVLYHELNHVLRLHSLRGKHLDPNLAKIWNMAADCEINDDLKEDNLLNLPDDCLHPSQFNMPNYETAEFYYKHLMENNVTQIDFVSCGSGATGHKEDHEQGVPTDGEGDGKGNEVPGISEQDAEVIRDKIAEKVEEAAKSRGNIPGNLKRWAEVHKQKKIDWRKLLAALIKRAFAQKAGKSDYTYQRMSRRHQGEKVIMPSTYEPVPNVSVVIDTSGSMGQKEIALALGETQKILAQAGARDGVNVLCVDAHVHTAKRVYDARQINVQGGGGTDMRIGIQKALEMKPRPDVVVVITDGYTPWPSRRPSANVIVALTTSHAGDVPSWARTVFVESEDD